MPAGASVSVAAEATGAIAYLSSFVPAFYCFSAASIASYVDSLSTPASSIASALIACYMAAKALSSSTSFY